MSAMNFNIGDLVEIISPSDDNPARRGTIMKIDTTEHLVLYHVLLRTGVLVWYVGSQLKGCGVNELAVPEPLAELQRLRSRVAELEVAVKPFAALAHEALKATDENDLPEYTWYQFNDVSITIAHLRAIDALAGKS